MIETIEQLRDLYAMPKERALTKVLSQLDVHCQAFIGKSPFLVVASASEDGFMDASPRGGPAGFVKIAKPGVLLIPDEPGNNRLDTLTNILSTGRVGLIFIIPGIDETLRVNGDASLRTDEHLIDLFDAEKRRPKLAIQVDVREAYLHCAKAFMRSKLWGAQPRDKTRVIPTMSEMISDQTGAPLESQESMLARYANDL